MAFLKRLSAPHRLTRRKDVVTSMQSPSLCPARAEAGADRIFALATEGSRMTILQRATYRQCVWVEPR